MFDVGYTEVLLIAVVALLVLGPDKLPGAMRTAGLWIARLRRSFDRIKSEIEQEVGADEIRRQIHNDMVLEQAAQIRREIEAARRSAQDTLQPVLDATRLEDAPRSRGEALARAADPTADRGAETAADPGAGPAEATPQATDVGTNTAGAADAAPAPQGR